MTDLSVCTTLRMPARAMSGAFDAALAPCSMHASHFAILHAINAAEENGVALSRLAEMVVLDRTSLYRALGPIQRSGWLTVAPAPKGRAKVATLSALGHEVHDTAAASWESMKRRALEAYGSERWAKVQPA